MGLGWDIEKEQRVFPLLFFALLPFDKFAACSVNIVIVCVLLRLGLPSGNNARDTIQENVLQITFRLVQTRLLLAQRKGFEPLVLLWEYTRFRVVRVRPLRHLCVRRFYALTFYYYIPLFIICQSFRQMFYT